MDRRTFIAAAGLGTGLAGCIDATEPSGGTGTDRGSESPASDTDSSTGDGAAENGGSERDVTFHSCTRATVAGTFEAGDVAFASTAFYDAGLFGNTILEDGIVFGDGVPAPFSGTVVFEVCDGSSVRAGTDEIVVEVPGYGSDGTVIASLTTRRADYERAAATHGNPHADGCLRELESGDRDTTFAVESIDTNAPIVAGSFLEVTVELENAGTAAGTRHVELIVGHDPAVVETRPVTLAPGGRTELAMGYETPLVEADQEFPVRVETGDDASTRSVLVHGTG